MAKVPTYETLGEKSNFFSNHPNSLIGSKEVFDEFYEKIKTIPDSYWRGAGNASHKLYTSLHRFWIENDLQNSHLTPADYIENIIFEARKWNEGLLSKYFDGLGLRNKLYDMSILSILRHHGTPVPFLDFTTDPRIALFFACDSFTTSASDNEIENYISLYEITKNHIARNHPNFKENLKIEFKKIYGDVIIPKAKFESFLNDSIIYDLLRFLNGKSFDGILIAKDELEDDLFYYINSSLNIAKQQGLFVMSFNINKSLEESYIDYIASMQEIKDQFKEYEFSNKSVEEVDELINKNLFDHFDNLKCYNIHRSLKNYILKRLRDDGIYKQEIYPDMYSLAKKAERSFLENMNKMPTRNPPEIKL